MATKRNGPSAQATRTQPEAPPSQPKISNRIASAVFIICGLLFAADYLVEKHGEGPFMIENWFGFYGLIGLVACVGLVLVATILRQVVSVSEDYYDR